MRNVLRIPYRLRLFILVPRARRFWLQIKPSDSGTRMVFVCVVLLEF